MIYLKSALGWFLLLTLVQIAYSIRCFSCQSSDDPKCADPFDNSTVPIINCKQEKDGLTDIRSPVCRKIRKNVNGEWNYIRDCTYLGKDEIQGDQKFCIKKTESDNVIVEYCSCYSKDGCNSSSVFSPIPLLIIFSFMNLIYNYGTSK